MILDKKYMSMKLERKFNCLNKNFTDLFGNKVYYTSKFNKIF